MTIRTTIEDMSGNELAELAPCWLFDGPLPVGPLPVGPLLVRSICVVGDKPFTLRFYRKGARLQEDRIVAQSQRLFRGAKLLGIDLQAVRVENNSNSLLVCRPL